MIDIGANLAHDSFDADRGAVLERAWAAGLTAILVTGSSEASSQRALELAREQCGKLFATAGVHPHHADDWNAESAALIRDLATLPEVVSLGECGLDYFRDLSPRPAQRRAFEAQLKLAADARKPVFLHQRDAHADFLPILREFRPHLSGAVVHCFTDSAEAMAAYLALDCDIGITGWICDERRGAELFKAAALIPDARLLAETDAPYLLPRTAPKPPADARGDTRRNEPAYLPWVIRRLAEARKQSEAKVAELTAANARRLFTL